MFKERHLFKQLAWTYFNDPVQWQGDIIGSSFSAEVS